MNEDMKLRLHNMVLRTKVLGPYVRTAIWFQGCNKRCKGCMSPSSRPLDEGSLVDVDIIINKILNEKDIEGITISGGEPFLQIDALHYLLKELKAKSNLGVIIYTGFKMEELLNKHDDRINEIFCGLADLIIDGEYIDTLNDGMALKGSSNQSLNFITQRYKSKESLYKEKHRSTEAIATEKDIFLIGIPEKNMLNNWISMVNDIKKDG